MYLQFYYWYEIILIYLILSFIPLLIGTILLNLWTYFIIFRKSTFRVSKLKYVLLLISQFMCSYILSFVFAIVLRFDYMLPNVIISEMITIPTFFFILKIYFKESS